MFSIAETIFYNYTFWHNHRALYTCSLINQTLIFPITKTKEKMSLECDTDIISINAHFKYFATWLPQDGM